MKNQYLSIILLLVALLSCSKKDTLFKEISPKTSNIIFENKLNQTEEFNLIEYLYFYNGGGVAVGDVNNDGLNDIYLSANQEENKLYLNKGNFIFEDITAKANLSSPGGWKTGVVMIDINGDGYLDIYQNRLGGYKNINGKNQLYINNRDLTFTEVAQDYGLDFEGFSTHSAFFDYDNDGDLDMYLLNHSIHSEMTYGNSKIRFQRDLKSGDKLFRHDIVDGKSFFTDVSESSGILGSNIGYGLGVSVSDINKDGCDDIYISNDFRENDYLYINNCDGTFSESLEDYIRHTSRFSMGNDIGDVNNDGLLDILVLDMLPSDEFVLKSSAGEDSYEIYKMKLDFGYNKQFTRNTLQLNLGNDNFAEIAQLSGIHATDWSWSTLIEDFDLDGLNDIFITNGILKRPNDMDYINFISNNQISGNLDNKTKLTNLELIDQMPDGKVSNYLFRNNSNLNFTDESENWGLDFEGYSNGATYSDLDNDGDLDLILNNINSKAKIYSNQSNEFYPERNFISINFIGDKLNKNGIGSKVTIWTDNKILYKENFANKGFLSSTSPGLVFGLNNYEIIDSMLVQWPSGKAQKLYSIKGNKILNLYEKEARLKNNITHKSKNAIFHDYTEKITPKILHKENIFNDFNREPLMPYMLSNEGPALAVADINLDGFQDLFLGSSSFNKSRIFMGTDNGNFSLVHNHEIYNDSLSEDVDALFFDADNDKDLDLYVVSGGNEFPLRYKSIRDRLYILNDKGIYELDTFSLPEIYQNGSIVRASDFDNDGDTDLFLGGRSIPGKYGFPPKHYLLENDGKGKFWINDKITFENQGMVTDATWVDIDNDGWMDLFVCGDWSDIKFYKNIQGSLIEDNKNYSLNKNGWWFSIKSADVNNDGLMDLIAGNIGLNIKFKPSVNFPVKMYINDFDNNESFEQIVTYIRNGKEYPLADRDEITKQLNYLKRKFLYFKNFAGQEIKDIFSKSQLDNSKILFANEFQSFVFLNNGKKFEAKPLPIIAQSSPISVIETCDFNSDNILDLLIFGNKNFVSTYFGSFDANHGILLKGKGDGTFDYVDQKKSGLNVRGEIKKMFYLDKNKTKFVLGVNDNELNFYKLNSL